jgi:L-2,4-diaminobutyric acid acetyltransferase
MIRPQVHRGQHAYEPASSAHRGWGRHLQLGSRLPTTRSEFTLLQPVTSVAESNGTLMGMITGYCIPGREHVLFVWQVAVGPQARGEGLAVKMLTGLLDRLPHVTRLEATVTPGNRASERLFERVAQLKGAPVDRTVGFRSDTHFQSEHDDEMLFSIGPFRSTPSPSQTIGV